MKKLIIIVLLITGCGGSDSHNTITEPPSNCITCLVQYPGINEHSWSGGNILWQTNDGTYIDDCSMNTPLPDNFTCDSTMFDCSNPHFIISTSDYWCQ